MNTGHATGSDRQMGSERHIRRTRIVVSVLACAAMLYPATGSCVDRPPQQDPAMSAGFAGCDNQAEQDAKRVMSRAPIAPTSVLSPILLLNELNQRKQEDENQPRLLNQIEQGRQQCRRNVMAAAERRAQETLDQRSDVARGYKSISFEAFALDGKSLAATQARVSLKGAYLPDGNFEWLFASQTDAIQATSSPAGARNMPRIPLLTDEASRDFRKALLRCKSAPGSDRLGCPTVITGHVSVCSITGPAGASRELPCVVVENGRDIR